MNTKRTIKRYYIDPLDALWLSIAKQIGLRVQRSSEVYASTDGQGTLLIGTQDTLDPDDCLAQMVLHELCHATVQGSAKLSKPDWGLDNTSERDELREHACLRLQALLLDAHGLREALAPTTDYRVYYDELPVDPLGPASDPAAKLARAAQGRLEESSWLEPIQEGLRATREIFSIASREGASDPGRDTEPLWVNL